LARALPAPEDLGGVAKLAPCNGARKIRGLMLRSHTSARSVQVDSCSLKLTSPPQRGSFSTP
jgi:hypothetical protein